MAVKYDPVLASIGSRIVKRREELGMSASELAIRADLTSSRVCQEKCVSIFLTC